MNLKKHQYLQNRRLDGPQNGLEGFGKKKTSCLCRPTLSESLYLQRRLRTNKYQILLISVKGRKIISSPKGPNRRWGPRSLILNGHRRSSPWVKRLKNEINH